MLNAKWSKNQQQQGVSSPSPALFAPRYYKTVPVTNPRSNPALGRARDSSVQGAHGNTPNLASIALNAGNKAQRPQPIVKKASPLKNGDRVVLDAKPQGTILRASIIEN